MLQGLLKKLLEKATNKDDQSLGERGENLAAKHLTRLGYKILQRNFKCKVGEIDIVARDGRTLVFAEVKTRADDNFAPELQVDAQKQFQITKAAEVYMSRFAASQPPARFDVIAIVWLEGREPVIRHHQNAFEAAV